MKSVTPAKNAQAHLGGHGWGWGGPSSIVQGLEKIRSMGRLWGFLYCPSTLGVHFLNDRSSAEEVGRGVGDKRQSTLRYGAPSASAT